jgi:CTP:molybdopterin cytidylyltransferase MocA/precorrin-6B methylase 2
MTRGAPEIAAPAKAPRVRAIVLAAGTGSRFGGAKLEAKFDGRPVLRHVLDALAEASLADPVLVVGPGSNEWGSAEQVVNPAPERGLASSLQLGWQHAMAAESPPDAVLVILGDQPLLRPEVVRALVAAPLDAARPVVAPRYADTNGHNPVRVEATAGHLIEAVSGDRGLGPILDRNPDLVRWLDVPGDNPDVDSAADLAHVAELAWADRVRRNREQVDRFREAPDGQDFYASVSAIFRDDPDRIGDLVLDALRAHARPGDTWLDIGAGAGRYALPLARSVRRVIALDPSPSMLDGLRETMVEHGISNVDVIEGRWPAAVEAPSAAAVEPGLPGGIDAGGDRLSEALPADVSLIAHVGYDIEAIGPFLEAMERQTRRECLAVLMERSPASLAEPFWPPLHGEERVALPALAAFEDLLRARGRAPSVDIVDSSRRHWPSREELAGFIRRQTWVAPGSAKNRRMLELLDEWLMPQPDGTVDLSVAEPLRVGLVAWRPG